LPRRLLFLPGADLQHPAINVLRSPPPGSPTPLGRSAGAVEPANNVLARQIDPSHACFGVGRLLGHAGFVDHRYPPQLGGGLPFVGQCPMETQGNALMPAAWLAGTIRSDMRVALRRHSTAPCDVGPAPKPHDHSTARRRAAAHWWSVVVIGNPEMRNGNVS
jgi:hypothetical protein